MGRVGILAHGDAVPGQTVEDWRTDLEQALALEPDHLSTYGLTYEKGTRLWKERQRGRVRPLGEDDELAMYRHAMEFLEGAGFAQYEISSFSQPGWRCRGQPRESRRRWCCLPRRVTAAG